MFVRARAAPALARAFCTAVYKNILSEKLAGGVGLVRLNRPPVNALNHALLTELLAALRAHEQDKEVGAIVLSGSAKAFAAGADIKEMVGRTFSEFKLADPTKSLMILGEVAKCTKPIVAAVDGFVFGGGLELAMQCDIIIASDKAVFGQPEIKVPLPSFPSVTCNVDSCRPVLSAAPVCLLCCKCCCLLLVCLCCSWASSPAAAALSG